MITIRHRKINLIKEKREKITIKRQREEKKGK
jgi:hypothetical protein